MSADEFVRENWNPTREHAFIYIYDYESVFKYEKYSMCTCGGERPKKRDGYEIRKPVVFYSRTSFCLGVVVFLCVELNSSITGPCERSLQIIIIIFDISTRGPI